MPMTAAQRGRNLHDVRQANRSVIFRTIRDAGGISRTELATRSGLNPATVTHIVRELIGQGVVEEDGYGASRGGRRRSLLRIRADAGYIVGISLERGSLQGLLADLDLKHTLQRSIPSSSMAQPLDITLTTLLGLIRTLADEAGVSRQQIIGIGLSAPGPLDARRGVLTAPVNMPQWANVPLRRIIEDEFGIPTLVDNNANTCALAEKWFGAAKELDNFVYLLTDTGVGAGVMVDGDIYRGAHDIAGEVGHTTIDRHGPRCGCGNTGCLELYASPPAAVAWVRQAAQSGRPTRATDLAAGQPDDITFAMVVQAAEEGDPVAAEALDAVANALAIGIANLINTLDPQVVFLGGRICHALPLLLDTLRTRVAQRVMCDAARAVAIRPSALPLDGPLVGAVCLVLKALFANPQAEFAVPAAGGLPVHVG